MANLFPYCSRKPADRVECRMGFEQLDATLQGVDAAGGDANSG